MDRLNRVVGILGCCFLCWTVLFLFAHPAGAVFLDGNRRSLELKGKAQTRVSIRLNKSEGFTNPSIAAGNLVQHRNLGILEVNHDLKYLTRELGILYPLRALNIRAKYHIVGRFLYEGVYDYGPQAFQDVRDRDKDNIDSFKQSYDLWECYLDLSRGPFFLRLGKQNLAWGETDIFRLLDYINPLDNTFGGPFEDLDDRRIPLWMLRGSYNLGRLGPVSSVTLEGFWVPGFWDVRAAPWAPDGTAYEAPLPDDMIPFIRIVNPDKKGSNSRWGVRVQGVLMRNLTLSAAHYKTFLDAPALRSVVKRQVPLLTELSDMELTGTFPDVQITGASMNYWEPKTDVILRAEVAWFWDEPVFIPEVNLGTLYGPTLPLPDPILDLVADVFGIDLRDIGLDGVPVNPQSGRIPKKNILRYMIGLDKQMWIRPLNRTNTFFFSLQYFGQWVADYDDRMRQGVPIYPDYLEFPKVKETEHVFTAIVNTMFRNGTITPQLALAYDIRGAWLIQPSVNLLYEPFRFMIQYSAIEGSFTNFGAFRDRDQVTFIFSYLLN